MMFGDPINEATRLYYQLNAADKQRSLFTWVPF
jgi:hypothetical protein